MKIFCVISHTHWDREWYRPFEVFRLRLVDLIDRLLDIIGEYPDYVFHLDAQTVVLEDYLEIRPERERLLKEKIRKGNIVVGPWYLQNDYMLTSGESTIRNLLRGTKIAQSFGHCMKVGYSPDQFGNVSQLPQILKGFGIDSFIFGRGFSKYVRDAQGNIVPEHMPAEFVWEGADGTRCLAVHMKYWYNNAQRFSQDVNKCRAMIESNLKVFEGCNVTPYMLMMNGVDHLEAQPDLLPVLQNLRENCGYDIRQYRLENYVEDVKKYLRESGQKLPEHKGELCMGGDYQLLRGCWSSRSYLKVANVEAQNALEKTLEPLCVFLEKQGFAGSYPYDQLRYAWRQTMRNQPHDSICGCSRDEVHAHMEDSYARTKEVTDELCERAMRLLNDHNDSPYRADKSNYVITVFNSVQSARGGVVRVRVEFLAEENVRNFRIVDGNGREAYFEVVNSFRGLKDVVSPVNLPGTFDVDIFDIDLYVEEMKPVSVRHYAVLPQAGDAQQCTPSRVSVLENEYFRVTARDGGVDLLIKGNNRYIADAFRWEESGDRGDSYVYQKTFEPEIYSERAHAVIEDISESELRRTVRVRNVLRVPKEYVFDEADPHRSREFVDCPVTYTVTVEKGCPYLEVGYEVENRACDHRLRFVVETGLKSEKLLTDSAFDTMYHDKSEVTPDSHFFGFCNANFAAIESKGMGVAVFSHGLHEVENIDGAMLFTVVRATGAITRMGLKVNGGPTWVVPGNQELRTLKGKVALYAYEGDAVAGGVKNMCNRFNAPLLAYCGSMDTKKWAGGRPAVQDSDIAEIFYLEDKYASVVSRSDASLYELDDDVIEVTAVKRAEDGKGFVVRLFNPSRRRRQCTFSMPGEIFSCRLDEKKGKRLGSGSAALIVRPKQLVTLRIE